MELISCHIENFGKISDLTIDFANDIHIFVEKNGWGKTTLAAFIRAMFYGLAGGNKQKINENERKRYKPWQGGIFGGQLVFKTGEKTYQIIRTFGTKDKEDTFGLYNAVTGKESNDYSSDIGEELFKINRESFERTIFIGQSDVATMATDSISAKIGNLSDNEDDINNYENVQKNIKDRMNALSPTRATGKIHSINEKISGLKVEILRGNELDKSIELLETKIKSETDKIKEYNNAKNIVKDNLKKASVSGEMAAKQQIYNSIRERYNEAERSLLDYGDMQVEDMPDTEVFGKHINMWSRRNDIKNALNSKKAAIEALEKNIASSKAPIGVPQLILGIMLMAVSLALMAMKYTVPGIILIALGILGIISSLFGGRNKMTKETNPEWLKLTKEIDNDEAHIEDLENKIYRFLDMVGIECNEDEVLYELLKTRDKCRDYKKIFENFEKIKKEKTEFESANDIKRIMAHGPEENGLSIDKLNRELSELDENIDNAKLNITTYGKQQEKLIREREQISEKEIYIGSLTEEADRLKKEYDLLKTTGKYLEKAKENFTSRYINPIMASFEKYRGILEQELSEEKKYSMDADIKLSFMEKGDKRDIVTLSQGYKDLAGICMRMAMVEAMYKEEKPFIIFDDPFVNLDDEKMNGGMKLLRHLSREYQIIYFTCHESRTY